MPPPLSLLAEYVSARFSVPVQVIQIRPCRNGWQCFEAPGVRPYWIGDHAKEMAVDYAKARAKFGRGEIRMSNKDGVIEEVIPFGEKGRL
jgi:hypothetical protein